MLSINTALRYTVSMVMVGLCSILLACKPPDSLSGQLNSVLGGSSSGGSSSGGSSSGGNAPPASTAVVQCSNGPADLSGQCRNTAALTPGALEVIEPPGTSVATSNSSATAQLAATSPTLNITWSPYPGNAWGYYVYYGPTSDSATTLASDLPIGTGNFNSSAPSVSYQPKVDLGLNTGATVCFLIEAYDAGGKPFNWSQTQCTVVS